MALDNSTEKTGKVSRSYSMSNLAGSKTTKNRFYRFESQADLSRYMDYGVHFAEENRWCFEIAWEVAHKVYI